ncbi:non-ribosomal peptide synthetase [Paenibacillus sp. UNC496MF]|uniref:non-ribosomal peptide synthetase n=1 Tax=Paenibacillus sp. UNC496MF TaxID=1502753 RepID=UPI001C4352B6|nr:non-ribosomal peptide synthetase [Paenibacillus sp. UNC496MF]
MIASKETSAFAAIQPAAARPYYPLSSAQKRMYVLSQMEGAGTSYNMPAALRLEGKLERERLVHALNRLIERHESLRTSFELAEGEAMQLIRPSVSFAISEKRATEAEADALVSDFIRPFDLSQAPLLRAALIKLGEGHQPSEEPQSSEERHLLLLDMPHIISDGVSMGVLVEEFMKLYAGEMLPDLRIQYKDYAVWEQERQGSEAMKVHEAYWLDTFKGELPVLQLPTDYPRPAMQRFEGDRMRFTLDAALTAGIKRLAEETGTTLYMVLLAAYNVLLSKYTGQEDLIVGTPIAGRAHADADRVMGMFVSTLALRSCPSGEKTFGSFLNEVKEQALEAFEHQEYPFETLVEKLNLKRDLSRNPLFDTMFVLQNAETKNLEIPELRIDYHEFEIGISQFEMTLEASEAETEIHFNLEYSTALFKAETISRMVGHYRELIQAAVREPEVRIGEMELLTEPERRQILDVFNATAMDYPQDKLIHELFEAQVERTPDRIAVVFEEQQLTYRELNARANQLARMLRKKGVQPDELVGILVDRSLDMVIGVLGVWKAGGAYVPLDPNYPDDRIQYMLSESGANYLLAQQEPLKRLSFAGQVVRLDNGPAEQEETTNLSSVTKPQHLAYAMFTSGTTGKPKAAMIEHGNLQNMIYAWEKLYRLDLHAVNVLQMASFSFDVFICDLGRSLPYGGKMVICPSEIALEPETVYNLVLKHGINILDGTPAVMLPMMKYIEAHRLDTSMLHWIMMGADRAPASDFMELYAKYGSKTRILNCYGATEACVDSSYYEADGTWSGENSLTSRNAPIGKPLGNIKYYITDANQCLQPIGIPGELYIGGAGVGRGYLNRPELTSERFVPNPFVPGELMYKTGDLVRWLQDGNVEYLGRIDHQVKVRGFRIELGEIEAQLALIEEVKEAAVIASENEEGQNELCAYVVSETELSVAQLRAALSRTLPGYMIPTYFVQLTELPLTPNGKIDRQALPAPDGNLSTGVEYAAPRNETEQTLAEIWQDVLNIEQVGINDHFFELGGHSLKAITLVTRIHKQLQVETPLFEVFRSPILHELAASIEALEKQAFESIEPIEEAEHYPLSAAQKRMYVLHQMQEASTTYNMPAVTQFQGPLDLERVRLAFEGLINRHEVLRTSFPRVNGEPVQVIHKNLTPFALDYVDAVNRLGRSAEDSAMQSWIDEHFKGFIKPFDLEHAPLIRAGVLRISEDRYLILTDMHHIIGDGISSAILEEEFTKLYAGETLAPLRIQYKDYVGWQTKQMNGPRMKRQQEFWLKQFAGEVPVLDLATDYPRPAVQQFEGDRIRFRTDETLMNDLKQVASVHGVTMNMLLLTAYKIMLHLYSGQENLVVGMPISGRTHADLENIAGVFINTLAIRSYPTRKMTIAEMVEAVKSTMLQAFENQDYPFEEVVKQVVTRRDTSRAPLFDTMFVMQNFGEVGKDSTSDQQSLSAWLPVFTAKFDLTMTAAEAEDAIEFELEFSTKLFNESTANRMSRHFIKVLQQMAAQYVKRLEEIELATPEEEHYLTKTLNETSTDFPKNKTLAALFEEQVVRTPEHTAVKFGDHEWTYMELNRKSNQMARLLQDYGVSKGDIVGILLDRSMEMIAGMLGILKVGAAYLPIDPENPQERIVYTLKDSGARLLLTRESLSNVLNGLEVEMDRLFVDDPALNHKADTNVGVSHEASDVAYVMYTSGTTGTPKGIMTKHFNISRVVKDTNYIQIGEDDKLLSVSNYAFDGFTFDFYGALLNGATLVLVAKEVIMDIEPLSQVIQSDGNTMMFMTTALFNLIVDNRPQSLTGIRKLLFGGERVSVNHVRKALEIMGKGKILHVYGPTESTVFATYYPIDTIAEEAVTIPIGKPLSNTKVYILGPNNQIQPIGAPGELCIAGNGLAEGYLNQPQLTSEKFVEHPFEKDQVMYRTGDLARFRPDGNIEFIDRIDQQVKIRGHRIELGEIEKQLLNVPHIKETIVLMLEMESKKQLCAYLVTDAPISVNEIREQLTRFLPEYMIPVYYVTLERMPLTTNGKIDRKALPEPDGKNIASKAFAVPRNETERRLLHIWKDVLSLEQIGIDDEFFEIGGHSLLIARAVSEINEAFQISLPFTKVFQNPTIRMIAAIIDELTPSRQLTSPDKQVVLLKEGISSAKHLFFIHAGNGDTGAYVPFSKNLSDNYHYWAISSAVTKDSEPSVITTEELARSYIQMIRKIQPEGVYLIAGWSVGGTIAFEMARQMEQMNLSVGLLAMIDSPLVLEKEFQNVNPFESEKEIRLLRTLFSTVSEEPEIEDVLEAACGSGKLWLTFIQLAEERGLSGSLLKELNMRDNDLLAQIVHDYPQADLGQIIQIYNESRSLTHARDSYIPDERVHAAVHFFQALNSETKVDVSLWQPYCSKPMRIIEATGNHYSIFREPDMQNLVRTFNELLEGLD